MIDSEYQKNTNFASHWKSKGDSDDMIQETFGKEEECKETDQESRDTNKDLL